MKKFLILVFTLMLTFSANTSANAAVITFDDLTMHAEYVADGYNGFDWDNLRIMGKDKPNSGYHNGVVSPSTVLYNSGGSPATVSLTGDTFNFNGTYLTAAWNTGLNITVTGFNDGLELYSTTVTVDTDEPTYFDFNYQDIDQVVFNSFGGTNNDAFIGRGTHFAMDNFTYNEAPPPPAPEPSTMILGLMGLGAAIRKRRKA